MDLFNKREKLTYILNNIFLKQVISKYNKTHFLAKRSPKVNIHFYYLPCLFYSFRIQIPL